MKNIGPMTGRPVAGFSLVELLTVIMIIAIMASMAMSFFGGRNHEPFENSRDRRNAQTIVTLATGASACGVAVVKADGVRATVESLIEGQISPTGVFKGKVFRMGPLTDEEIEGALRYVRLEGDALVYSVNGG